MMTAFQEIIGNREAKELLGKLACHKVSGRTFLFHGPKGVGKSLFASDFAFLIFGEDKREHHPDLFYLRPHGKTGIHTIDSIHQLCREMAYPPYRAKQRVFIIEDADRMLTYSANALLKTLEEPSKTSVIILLSAAQNAILPTILSRSLKIRFDLLSKEEMANWMIEKKKIEEKKAKEIAILARGSLSRAIEILQQGEDALFLKLLNLIIRGKTLSYSDVLKTIREISKILEKEEKQMEKEVRAHFASPSFQDLPVASKNQLEKEIEGALTMFVKARAFQLFNELLFWYRDLHLLSVNGDPSYLMHPNLLDMLEQTLQKGELLPLNRVEKAVEEARLALERSTPLAFCLENLFLKLNG